MEEFSWARRMAQPYLEGFAKIPISGSETLGILRELGLGYRTGEFYKDWRKVLGLLRYEAPVTGLLPETFIPKGWMEEISREVQQFGAAYRYEFNVAIMDPETGEIDVKEWSYSSDVYMAKGAVEKEYFFEVPWEVSKPDVLVMDVQLRGGWHQEGAPW